MKTPGRKKALLSALAILVAVGTYASSVVKVERVAQRYPWNGLVDIDYTVEGVLDPAYYSLKMSVSSGAWTNELTSFLGTSPAVSNGRYRVTWNAAADGVVLSATNAVFSADLIHHPIVSDGDYMIVDISAGINAEIWPVTYISGVDNPDERFNTDEYKTTKLVFRKVKAGSFWMGSTDDETSAFYDDEAVVSGSNSESPRHFVKLTKDYFLQIFELTAQQYILMTGTNSVYNQQYYPTLMTIPVCGLSKITTRESGFPTAALNQRAQCAGLARTSFSLPTEAQWEYAARAGTTTRYFLGDDAANLADFAWYTDKVTTPSWGHHYQSVGMLVPNPWGFYDIYGNAGEHVLDDLGAYPSGDEENPVVNPCYINTSANIIRRGGLGTWGNASSNRSAARNYTTQKSMSDGVRLAFTCE